MCQNLSLLPSVKKSAAHKTDGGSLEKTRGYCLCSLMILFSTSTSHEAKCFLHTPESLFWNGSLMLSELNSFNPGWHQCRLLACHCSGHYQTWPVKAWSHQTTVSHQWTHSICSREECICFTSTPTCLYSPHCLANKASCNTKYTPDWCSAYYLCGEKTSQTVK